MRSWFNKLAVVAAVAVLVALKYLDGVTGLTMAYIPLIILVLYYKAGASELQRDWFEGLKK